MYIKSKARINKDKSQANWERRMYIFIKRNQGWTYQQIADTIGTSRQNVAEIYGKIKKMSIEELEQEYLNWGLTDTKK
jgi:transcriptional regulator